MESEVIEERKDPGKPGFLAALRGLRAGQWLRLAAVAACLLALVLYLVLPQIVVGYQRYDNETVGDRVLTEFPLQMISGINNFFGGTDFVYYKGSAYQSVEVLVSQTANFNWFALGCFLLGLISCGMTIWLNFTRKNEKWSKLITLFYVIVGLMMVMGPIWFIASNGFGGGDYHLAADASVYWNYYELYVHDAYGALVCGIIAIAAGVLFSVGTSLERGKGDARMGGED